jgi:anti-sigma factor RsiW
MTCRQVDEQIEMVASGEEAATDAFRSHVEGCIRCASALATARRVHEALEGRPAPVAPAKFTASVLARVRTERWRSEQQVDRLFNAALVVGVLAVVGGIVALFNLGGVISAVGGATDVLGRLIRESSRQAAPVFSTYLLAGGLLGVTLVAWWIAERRMSL